MAKSPLPYENAKAGSNAMIEAEKILRSFGCVNFGTMTDWQRGVLICQFQWKERRVSIEASWRGYAEAWLMRYPWTPKRRCTQAQWQQRAQACGEVAAPSILRDWIKGQVTAVEVGMMPFEHAFMSHILLPTGERLIDKAQALLPSPTSNVTELKR